MIRKNLLIVVGVLVFSLGSACLAYSPAIIGGVRNGLGLGIIMEEGSSSTASLRFGAEATTGSNPLCLFIGGKFYLSTINATTPLSLGLGVIGDFGSNNGGNGGVVGVSVSAIFDHAFAVQPLFIEAGIDVINSGGLQLQAGYRF